MSFVPYAYPCTNTVVQPGVRVKIKGLTSTAGQALNGSAPLKFFRPCHVFAEEPERLLRELPVSAREDRDERRRRAAFLELSLSEHVVAEPLEGLGLAGVKLSCEDGREAFYGIHLLRLPRVLGVPVEGSERTTTHTFVPPLNQTHEALRGRFPRRGVSEALGLAPRRVFF